MKVLKCMKCGNMELELKKGVCNIQCCGEEMKELVPGETDGAAEKHVPDVTVGGNKVSVVVGSAEHPMLEEHHIEFIALETTQGVSVKYLNADDAPKAEFLLSDGDKAAAVYEHCNLHGLWKAEV